MYKALLNQPIGTLESELLYQPETNHFTPSSFVVVCSRKFKVIRKSLYLR